MTGRMEETDVRSSPLRHVLSGLVGCDPRQLTPEVSQFKLSLHDKLLLCTQKQSGAVWRPELNQRHVHWRQKSESACDLAISKSRTQYLDKRFRGWYAEEHLIAGVQELSFRTRCRFSDSLTRLSHESKASDRYEERKHQVQSGQEGSPKACTIGCRNQWARAAYLPWRYHGSNNGRRHSGAHR